MHPLNEVQPSPYDITGAVKRSIGRKAAGVYNILAEFLKTGGEAVMILEIAR